MVFEPLSQYLRKPKRDDDFKKVTDASDSDDSENPYSPHQINDIAESGFCGQCIKLFKNIHHYHSKLNQKKAIASIASSSLFLLDIGTDFAYLSQDGLERVEVNQRIWDFRLYLTISVLSPLAIEIAGIYYRKDAISKDYGYQLKATEVIARILN